MELFSAEHYALLEMFEREFKGLRLDREDRRMWQRGHVYQSGEANNLFLAYRKGYAFGRAWGGAK